MEITSSPIKINKINIKLLSNIFTEYRDYKFSNGFYWVGIDIKGNYINKEIIDNVNKLSTLDKLELLNSLYSLDEELYSDAIKIFKNIATKEEYYNFTEKLEKNGIMKYNWQCFYDAQK
jgi:hypothetical protein